MAKATSFWKKLHNWFFPRQTVRRITFLNVTVMIGLYVLVNLFTFGLLDYLLGENLEVRLSHEAEHIMNAFAVENGELILTNPAEFQESDLSKITENPFFLQVFDLDGNQILGSENLKLVAPIPRLEGGTGGEFYFTDAETDDYSLRVCLAEVMEQNGTLAAFMQLSTPKKGLHTVERGLIMFNLFTFPLMLLLIVVASVILARRSLAPVRSVVDVARRISASNLRERVEYDADPEDELGKLRDTLNELFNRLEQQIDHMSQFSDNASHQLMTPLTGLKTELEFILRKDRTTQEYRDSMLAMRDGTESMIQIVSTMLLLAKQCEACANGKSVFNLSRLVDGPVRELYEGKGVDISTEEELYVRGKSEYFQMVLQNLIDNALKYSENGGRVTLSVMRVENHVRIDVADQGIGIPAEDREKVFERFYRTPYSEDMGIEGHGLGLSLVKSVVTAMGGSVRVADNESRGTRIQISLPSMSLN
jgi:signal transduction histidine kinase